MRVSSEARARILICLNGLLLLVGVIGACITEDKKSLTHLTYWSAITQIVYACTEEIFHAFGRPTVFKYFHIPITQITWFVAGAMLSLSIQDDAVVKQAEEEASPALVGIANLVLHFTPPFFLTYALCEHPPLFMERHALSFAHYTVAFFYFAVVPLFFPLVYGNIYDAHDQYPGNFDPLYVYLGGLCGCVVGGVLLLRRITRAK
jgi:hypothetical protein